MSSYLDNLLGIQVSIIVEAKVSCVSFLKVKIAWNAILKRNEALVVSSQDRVQSHEYLLEVYV